VVVYLVKPRIERLDDGRLRASYEDGRFSTVVSQARQYFPIEVDPEPSQRFIWIYPAFFGKNRGIHGEILKPWDLTLAYDEAFRRAAKGSSERRWIAEGYLNLVIRRYRLE